MARTAYAPQIAQQRGFTLLEIVVALAIFAVLSVMAYSGLDQVLRARDATDRTMDRLSELQLAWSLIGRDLEQAATRGIRDGFGDPQAPMNVAGDNLIELTRGGWPNPLRRPRGHLQRVAYHLDGEVLQRLSWNVLDRAQDSEPRVAELLTGVTGVELRFMDQQGDWGSQWPPQGNVDVGEQTPLPRGMEVVIELQDMGRVGRLFQVSQWLPPPERRRVAAQPQQGDDANRAAEDQAADAAQAEDEQLLQQEGVP
jgi:general secretion pathway protein J